MFSGIRERFIGSEWVKNVSNSEVSCSKLFQGSRNMGILKKRVYGIRIPGKRK